jgi:hypothetical protein
MLKSFRISSQSGSYSAAGTESGFLSYSQHEIFLSIASDNSRHGRIGVFSGRKKWGEYQVQVTMKLTAYPSSRRNSLKMSLNYIYGLSSCQDIPSVL